MLVVAVLPLLSLLPIGAHEVVAVGAGYSRQVVVANVDGTGQRTVTTIGNNFSPSWSPDGSKIVMTSDRQGGWDVYVHDLQSGSDTRITESRDGSNADWSPKSNELVFAYSFGVLGKRNADGTGTIKNLPGLPNIYFTQPVFSPNGQLIASYGETVNGGPRLVFVQKADGTGKPIELEGQEGEKNWQPEWQSDTLLSYVSMRRDGTYLVTYNLVSRESLVVKKVNGLGELSWNSRSGLAYSWYDTQHTLVSIENEAQEERVFGIGNEPAWSADGTRLAYVAGTIADQGGWICPIPFNGMTGITIQGTDPVTVTVTLYEGMDNLRIKPSAQSNLEGPEVSWDKPGPGDYSGSWGVTNILSPTVEFTVHSVWNGYPIDDWYQCARVQYYLNLMGSQVQSAHIEGLDFDEVVSMQNGHALRPWLREGVYVVTPLVDGVEQHDLRRTVQLIGRDATVSWEIQPIAQAGSKTAYLPFVTYPGSQ